MSITLEDLTIGYRTRSGDITVANGINASVESGRLTCLIGENGVGKSTLLRTMEGFQPTLGGHIYIDGKDSTLYTPLELAREVSVVLTTKQDFMRGRSAMKTNVSSCEAWSWSASPNSAPA